MERELQRLIEAIRDAMTATVGTAGSGRDVMAELLQCGLHAVEAKKIWNEAAAKARKARAA